MGPMHSGGTLQSAALLVLKKRKSTSHFNTRHAKTRASHSALLLPLVDKGGVGAEIQWEICRLRKIPA